MAETNLSLIFQNHNLAPFHAALDLRKPLILSQFSDPTRPNFAMERGPRFKEYSDLRERRLRLRSGVPDSETDEKLRDRSVLTPQRKQVKFGGSGFATPPKRSKIPSFLTQSVPDFSSALRKENRRPAMATVAERSVTPPPPSKSGRVYGKVGGGSKSTNTAEKRSGGLLARKSYANLDELKKSGAAAGKEINGGKIGRGGAGGKAVLGNRQF